MHANHVSYSIDTLHKKRRYFHGRRQKRNTVVTNRDGAYMLWFWRGLHAFHIMCCDTVVTTPHSFLVEIGTRFIKSDAANSLFVMNQSTAKIMILGRWSSEAFLHCIRPQVLESTNNMSRDICSTMAPISLPLTLTELTRPTHEYGATVSMRIPSFLPGFASITKERSEGNPALL